MFENIKEIDWARLAAFIDGEGCISVQYNCRKGQKKLLYQLRLQITNTDPKLMVWLKRFGVGKVVMRHQGPIWKNRYDWVACGREAAAVLEQCIPYFVMKSEQAVLAISFQSIRKHWGKGGMPENVRSASAFVHRMMGKLKQTRPPEMIQ